MQVLPLSNVTDGAFVLQTPASGFSLPEEDTLLQACRAALQRRTEFEAIDASTAFSELAGNRMMVMYYQRSENPPPETLCS